MSGPVRADGGAFFLTALVGLIDDRLQRAGASSAAALAELGRGDAAAGLSRLREAEPALAELSALVRAALALGERLEAAEPHGATRPDDIAA